MPFTWFPSAQDFAYEINAMTTETGAMPKLQQLVINPCAHLRKLPEVLWHTKSFHKFVLWWPRPELKPALQVFMDKEQYDTQLWNMINLVLTYHVFSMFHLKLV